MYIAAFACYANVSKIPCLPNNILVKWDQKNCRSYVVLQSFTLDNLENISNMDLNKIKDLNLPYFSTNKVFLFEVIKVKNANYNK